MPMSKKHYVSIARVLREEHDIPNADRAAVHRITEGLVSALAQDNPRFSPSIFRQAALGHPGHICE